MGKARDTSFPSAQHRRSPAAEKRRFDVLCEKQRRYGSRARADSQVDAEYSVRSLAEYVTLMTSSNFRSLRPFTRTMVALGIVVSFLVSY